MRKIRKMRDVFCRQAVYSSMKCFGEKYRIFKGLLYACPAVFLPYQLSVLFCQFGEVSSDELSQ